jgi:hypothetical protein
MKLVIIMVLALFATLSVPVAWAQLGKGDSPFERDYQDIKFLDAYFGTFEQKMEVAPGDKNVPFTIVFANVGTEDITGIKGQLQLPLGFNPAEGKGALILADAERETLLGKHFSLTFYVNLDKNLPIQQYPGTVMVEYSRFREAGQRQSFFDFTFKVTGESIINLKAMNPFLTSIKNNEATIEISNTGTAPLSNVKITLQNTQTAVSATANPITNVENVVFDQNEWDVGTIDPRSSKKFSFKVFIPENIRTETLHMPLQLTYFNAHGEKITETRTVDFYINGLIDTKIYNVGVIDLSGTPTVIGEVINEGNTNALFAFVTLEPLGDSNIKKVTQFVDEIEIDSPVPFNIPVEFDGEPKWGEHEIRITVRYKDDLRNETIITHDTKVMLTDTSKKPTPTLADFAPMMAVVAIVAVVGVMILKKIKKRKEQAAS